MGSLEEPNELGELPSMFSAPSLLDLAAAEHTNVDGWFDDADADGRIFSTLDQASPIKQNRSNSHKEKSKKKHVGNPSKGKPSTPNYLKKRVKKTKPEKRPKTPLLSNTYTAINDSCLDSNDFSSLEVIPTINFAGGQIRDVQGQKTKVSNVKTLKPVRLNKSPRRSAISLADIRPVESKKQLNFLRGKVGYGNFTCNPGTLFNISCTRAERYGNKQPTKVDSNKVKLTRFVTQMSERTEKVLNEQAQSRKAHVDHVNQLTLQMKERKEFGELQLEDCAEISEDEQDEQRQKFRYGIYGNVAVFRDNPPPEPPTLTLEDDNSKKKDKYDINFETTDTPASITYHAERRDVVEEFEDDQPVVESKYPEDTDYKHFFLVPPPVYTHQPPKSITPPSIVPVEDLPDPKRPRREGKSAIGICCKVTGLKLEPDGTLEDGEINAFKRTIASFLQWVRFTVVCYEEGLEIRSTRTLCMADFEPYLVRQLKAGRVKVGVVVWLNNKDIQRAADNLASVTSTNAFSIRLNHESKSLAAANGIQQIDKMKSLPRMQSTFLTDGQVLLRADTHLREELESIPIDEADKYSVLSPASSAALWNITVRIQAGLEISQELLQQAKQDLELRRKQFHISNRTFVSERKRTTDGYNGAINIISNWRKKLYGALLSSEYRDESTSSVDPLAKRKQSDGHKNTIGQRHSGVLTT